MAESFGFGVSSYMSNIIFFILKLTLIICFGNLTDNKVIILGCNNTVVITLFDAFEFLFSNIF